VRKPFRRSEIYGVLARHLGLRFVYAEEQPQPAAPPCPAEATALAEGLLRAAPLPEGWMSEMQEALIQADLERILALVDLIREREPALADVLAGLALDFEYRGIQVLLDRIGGEP
jgi:hypothetical protein